MVTQIEIILSNVIRVESVIKLKLVKDHDSLDHLDYAHSGHTGFASEQSVTTRLAAKADLVDGIVPSSQLPSYVDDVIEFSKNITGNNESTETQVLALDIGVVVYQNSNRTTSSKYGRRLLTNTDGTLEGILVEEPSKGKIYVNLNNGNCYRWSGTDLVEVSKSLSLGETSTTAYAGNKGKANADAIAAIKDGTNIDSFSDVEVALDNKLGIKTTTPPLSDQLYLYAHNGSNQTETRATKNPDAGSGTIPMRDSNGNIRTSTPINSSDCTNKDYVDKNTMKLVGFYDSATSSGNTISFPYSQTQIVMVGYKYDAGTFIEGHTMPLFNNTTMKLAPDRGSDTLVVENLTTGNTTRMTIHNVGMSYFRILVIETNMNLPN